jgi:hypothetical protein
LKTNPRRVFRAIGPILPAVILYLIEGRKIEFQAQPLLTISSNCRDSCAAYKALKKVVPERTLRPGRRGPHPGAALCAQASGRTVIGVTTDGAQNSFCAFTDGSLVSNGSLIPAAADNEKR